MNALAILEPFFAPVDSDLLDSLLERYGAMQRRIHAIGAMIDKETAGALGYFIEGCKDDRRYAPSVEQLFNVEHATAALNADFWQRTMDLTDIYNAMPQKRRDEWNEVIRNKTAPAYTEETVRSTIGDLLQGRGKFLAERVDGMFRGLSGEHVTNQPQGFGKRMIISYVFSEWGSINDRPAGLINDLRCIIAKFMGRDEPRWNTTSSDLDLCRCNYGEWQTFDGGAIRIRVYKKATAHLEVHPDMAWRLNAILHTLYPRALAPSARQRPEKPSKEFAMIGRPLPFAVLALLRESRLSKGGNTISWNYLGQGQDQFMPELIRVLESIGGVKTDRLTVTFDYPPDEVRREILMTGCVPDRKAHQFYPTPENVAQAAVAMARIGEFDVCLEPSAGTGNLAVLLPAQRTHCVEISPLHCAVLKAKGYAVEQADFIEWAKAQRPIYSRIVMNPPYSEGRWMAHLKASASLLLEGGRLVAILPASARGKVLIEGFTHEWSDVFANEFAGTSVSVAIVAIERAA